MTQSILELSSSHADGILTVGAAGEIDMNNAQQLAAAIGGTSEATTRVIVDLSQITFLDSSALHALVVCRRALAERDVSIRVVSPNGGAVRNVLEIAHLTDELNVVDSLDAANG
jgi:stage II sporulation protein AA (anti-sigma F factor antagonist)